MNFFKDITENTSIGSKIKNISQANWLPDTKDIIANAASSIATNLSESNSTQSQSQSSRPPSQVSRQKSDSSSRQSSSSPSKLYNQKTVQNQFQYDNRSRYEEDEPVYETSKKLPQIPKTSRTPDQIRTPISQRKSFRSQSPESPVEDKNKIDPLQYTALVETNQALKTELQRLSVYETKCKQLEKDVSNNKALKETNENLQNQIQNLLEFREKCEKLELDLKTLRVKDEKLEAELKTQRVKGEKLETELKTLRVKDEKLETELSTLRVKNEKLETELKTLRVKDEKLENEVKGLRARDEKLNQNFDVLTDENINLTNKIKDMDRLVEENDSIIRELRHRETQMKHELDVLRQSKNEMNDQRLNSLEQANKILENELEAVKEHQKIERDKLKEKMGLLNTKHNEKLKRLEDEKKMLEHELNRVRHETESSMSHEIVTLKDLNQKYEDEIELLKSQLKDKKTELDDVMKQREIEIKNYLEKLKLLNDENMNLCNQFSSNSMSKDEELNMLSKKLSECEKDCGQAKQKLSKLQGVEKELGELKRKNEELIHSLREECEMLRHELDESRSYCQQYKHEMTNEKLKNENMAADYSLLKLELNKLELFKQKCEHLEKELDDLKRLKTSKINEFETTNKKYNESSDKYDYEIRILNTQINSLQNDLKLKDQEHKQLEKILESERNKTMTLMRQIDELKTSNSDLTIQLSDSKRRLISLDLLTEECNQLRKNLTIITIESEQKKAECTTLNSQVGILEHTLKSLRDATEKHGSLESSYETAVYELRKKQDDLKKLQQVHETVKKEHLETIELLEEKLKDVEKKTELQALKHEEILLELESIRARRERLLPLCPNCSSQTYPMYHPMNPPNGPQSQSQSPKPQYVPYVHPHGQLLSISIPQQSLISPIISPLNLQGLQFITLPGKQSVTVECQTSPEPRVVHTELVSNIKRDQIEQQAIDRYKKTLEKDKYNRSVQTYEIEIVKKYTENRGVNTDHVEVGTKSNQTVQIVEAKPTKPVMKHQSIYVNIYDEIKRNSMTQTMPVMPKVLDDKQVQCDEKDLGLIVKEKDKYFLYMCKYNYDPIKMSPNQNPALELNIKTGDYMFVLSDKGDDGFLSGELVNGKRGLVPSNFVERVKIDSSSIFKFIETLPKDLLTCPKFSDMMTTYDINIGQIIIQYQDQIKTIQSTPPPRPIDPIIPISSQPIVAPKQQIVSKTEKQYMDQKIDEQIKIGLPYPNNLRVEKRTEKSLLIYWDPPSAPLPLDQSIDNDNLQANDFNNRQTIDVSLYNLFLNNELHSVINGNDDHVAVLDDIDLSVPNRISIQAMAGKDRMSKPQECTLLFGSNRSFAPSNLAVHNLSQTSAIVSWWPSSSQFSHVISIDSIEHRTLKPGVYRFKLSGLLPDTSHFITITAQIHNHTTELNSNHAASIEFRTLSSRTLATPIDLALEKDSNEPDSFVLSWNPVISIPTQLSNGIPVGGYSIYLDGTRVHQILNPIASSVSLSSKLLNGAKVMTVRTLSLDGNFESKDSEPIKLSKSFLDDLIRKKSISKPEPPIHAPTRPKPVQPEIPSQVKRVSTQLNQMPKVSDAIRKKSKLDTKLSVDNETDLYENNRVNPVPVTSNVLNAKKKTSRQGSPNSSVGGIVQNPKTKTKTATKTKNYRVFIALFDYDPFKMSPNTDSCQEELPFKEGQLIKIFGDQDPDGFYYGESNGRAGFIPCNMVSEVQVDDQEVVNKLLDTEEKQKPRKQSLAQKGLVQKPSSSSKVSNLKPIKQMGKEQQFVPINKYSKSMTMIALYDYDPQSLSPNADADAELPFKTGQIITVFDEMDEDGFFMAELNGKRGLVPSNFLQPLDQNSQYATNENKK